MPGGGSRGDSGGSWSPPDVSGGSTGTAGRSGTRGVGATTRGTPTAPIGVGAATTGPGATRALACVRRGSITSFTEDAWWTWWQLNKHEHLPANAMVAIEPQGGRYAQRDESHDARDRVIERLNADLDHRDAEVRAAAAVAFGRLAAGDAVPGLIECLSDPSLQVREAAILGLGATGAARVAPLLLALASDGRLPGNAGRDSVSPDARPLALLALGLGRRHGLTGAVDGFVTDLLDESGDDERTELGSGALLFHALTGNQPGPYAQSALVDPREALGLRCRAAESLPLGQDPSVLPELDGALHDAQLDLRRSAALALGRVLHPSVRDELVLHYERESEEMVRGFLLLSIARQGGPTARDFLLEVLDEDDSRMAPWAALALGTLARRESDEIAREALQRAALDEGNRTTRLALMLACGLSRNGAAVEQLADELSDSGDARTRVICAQSLALIGDAAARQALLDGLDRERSDEVRAAVAEALGHLGDERDADVLLSLLDEQKRPELVRVAALALGHHGSRRALDGLVERAEERRTSETTRAAIYDALGLLLDPHSGRVLPEAAQHSNFAVLPDWIDRALAASTL
jgi:HEAT repeat protein